MTPHYPIAMVRKREYQANGRCIYPRNHAIHAPVFSHRAILGSCNLHDRTSLRGWVQGRRRRADEPPQQRYPTLASESEMSDGTGPTHPHHYQMKNIDCRRQYLHQQLSSDTMVEAHRGRRQTNFRKQVIRGESTTGLLRQLVDLPRICQHA